MRNDLKITSAVAAALLASACQRQTDQWTADRDTAICTDRTGRRIADASCGAGGHGAFVHGGSGGARRYYVSSGSPIPFYGDRVSGGSYMARAGANYAAAPAETAMTRAAAVSRGGFGSTAGGEGGEGGGHGGGAGE